MLSLVLDNKDVRICLECSNGLIIGDSSNYETQQVYCLNCGTKHSYKTNKKGRTKITKFNIKCHEDHLEKIRKENYKFMKLLSQAICKKYHISNEELER